MSAQDRRLGWNSVGVEDGSVNLWMIPLWLKGNLVVKADLSPKTARKLAVQLLTAADAAEAEQ